MELKRLRYFVTVGELRSFTLAAKHLGIAQPALSRHIRELETECGSALLRRNGRGAELTDVGTIVFEHAQSLLEQVDRLAIGLKARKGAPVGTVALGMPPSVCMILVEPLFQRVRTDFPGIRLHISEGFSGDVREWLLGGRLDIGVLYNPGRNANLISQPLLVEDMFLCGAVNGGHKSAERKMHAISLAEATKLPLVLPGRPHGLRLLFDSACSQVGLTPDVVLELDAMAVIKDLVVRGEAFTILPFSGVFREVGEGKLFARKIVTPSISRSLVVSESVRRSKSPATTAVIRALHDEVLRLIADGSWLGRQ